MDAHPTSDLRLSPTMRKLVAWMREHGDSVYRHPGGFWWDKDPGSAYRSQSFGTSTVEALVARGVAEYVEWKPTADFRSKFPIQAKLK